MKYLSHGEGVYCMTCRGITDQVVECPCGSHDLVNIEKLLQSWAHWGGEGCDPGAMVVGEDEGRAEGIVRFEYDS